MTESKNEHREQEKTIEWKLGDPFIIDDTDEFGKAVNSFLDFMHNQSGIKPGKQATAYSLAMGVINTAKRNFFLAGFWNGACFWANQREYLREHPDVAAELDRAVSHGENYQIVKTPGEPYRLMCHLNTTYGETDFCLGSIDFNFE